MEAHILEHYRDTGTYTYAGDYKEYFRSLPDDIAVLGRLVCSQVITQGNIERREHQCECGSFVRRYEPVSMVSDEM